MDGSGPSNSSPSRGRPIFWSRNIRNVPEYFYSVISVLSAMFRNTVDDGEVAHSGWCLIPFSRGPPFIVGNPLFIFQSVAGHANITPVPPPPPVLSGQWAARDLQANLWPKCMLVCPKMMIPINANYLLRPNDCYLQSEPLTRMMKRWCNLFGADCQHLP